ncbi:hypothetical protein [Streptomyces sp. 5-10]|uniref:hypothetical protein n=1 Tax=Streptomyces sp. 5-10 TaxID=878925 RepID=UPI00168BA5DE|nr:hypothetical protein [Streptomyces sp. 5-10]MBD3004716.1 hypothetical protein [Streptomyces sp. 5-10]
MTAMTGGTPFTITLQTVRLCINGEGYVEADLLNPNDPTIEPGPATARRWGYCVRETFERGPVLGWTMDVPTSVGDGEVLDMAKVVRRDEAVYRPADWFPHHLMDTPVQASRISPRVGPLMRCIEEKPVRVPDGPREGSGDPGWVPPFGRCGCCCG